MLLAQIMKKIKIPTNLPAFAFLPWPLFERQAMVCVPINQGDVFKMNRQEQTCLQWSDTVCSYLDSLQLSVIVLTF